VVKGFGQSRGAIVVGGARELSRRQVQHWTTTEVVRCFIGLAGVIKSGARAGDPFDVNRGERAPRIVPIVFDQNPRVCALDEPSLCSSSRRRSPQFGRSRRTDDVFFEFQTGADCSRARFGQEGRFNGFGLSHRARVAVFATGDEHSHTLKTHDDQVPPGARRLPGADRWGVFRFPKLWRDPSGHTRMLHSARSGLKRQS